MSNTENMDVDQQGNLSGASASAPLRRLSTTSTQSTHSMGVSQHGTPTSGPPPAQINLSSGEIIDDINQIVSEHYGLNDTIVPSPATTMARLNISGDRQPNDDNVEMEEAGPAEPDGPNTYAEAVGPKKKEYPYLLSLIHI